MRERSSSVLKATDSGEHVEKVRTVCKKYMDELLAKEGDLRLIVGVSGGADSICLLFLLKESLPSGRLRVVHVNHMIRGMEADEDSLYVKKICDELGVIFKEYREDVPALAKREGLSEEEAGRRLRYRVFDEEASCWEKEESLRSGSVRIAVAHHIEDSAETVLFNLFRGSGIRGLSGISPERDRIIRPLLGASREDIEDYLDSRGISYRTDETNSDISISRNRIRNRILPEAESICHGAGEHIVSASDKLRAISEYLTEEARGYYEDLVDEISEKEFRIDREGFLKVPKVLEEIMIGDILTFLTPEKKDIGEVHIDTVISIASAGAGKHADLPYGITADISGKEILLRAGSPDEDEPYFLMGTVRIKASELAPAEREALEKPSDPPNGYTKYFDCDKISLIASKFGITEEPFFEIRKRRDGDHLVIRKQDGSPGTKSLSDYLTDLKLNTGDKERIRVLAVGNEVLWVIGHRMGDSAKLSEGTENILMVEIGEKEKHG